MSSAPSYATPAFDESVSVTRAPAPFRISAVQLTFPGGTGVWPADQFLLQNVVPLLDVTSEPGQTASREICALLGGGGGGPPDAGATGCVGADCTAFEIA